MKPPYPSRPVAVGQAHDINNPPAWVRPAVEGPPRPPAQRRSEEAARAAQYVTDLEADLGQAQKEIAQLKNLLQLEEERNKVLSTDLKIAQFDRDYYQKRTTEVMTKLTIAGSIILDAMKEPPDRDDPGQRAAVQEAAAKALRGDDTLSHDPPEPGGHS